MKNAILSTVAALTTILILTAAPSARSDDIDIYIAQNVAPVGAGASVMFSLDWRPNLSSTVCNGTECDFLVTEGYLASTPTTLFDLLRAVLKRVIGGVDANLNLGLMVSHDDGNGPLNCEGPQSPGSKCNNGGMILKGFEPIDNATSPGGFFEKLDAMPVPQGGKSHKHQAEELFFEFFRYITGQDIHNGHNAWTDWGTNSSNNVDEASDTVTVHPGQVEPIAELSWDCNIQESSNGSKTKQCADMNYIAPDLGACGKLFTINILFQVGNQTGDTDAAIVATKANGGMAGIDQNGDGKLDNKDMPSKWSPAGNQWPAVLKWLNDADLRDGSGPWGGDDGFSGDNGTQNVTSFFIVDKVDNKTNAYADAGGTGSAIALSDDPRELIQIFEDIFDQILSVSTTFVSPAVPVSTFNRLNVVPESFLALFRPDDDGLPFWPGDIKRLELVDLDNATGPDNEDFELRDANGVSAASAVDGRIKRTALTFWTHKEDITPATIPPEADYAFEADGRSVIHGGVGGVIPGYVPPLDETTRDGTFAGPPPYSPGLANNGGPTTAVGPREIYTDDPGGSGLMDLDADNATTSVLLLQSDDVLFKTLLSPLTYVGTGSGFCTEPCQSYDDYAGVHLGDPPDSSRLLVQDEARSRMMELIAWMRGLEAQDGTFDNATQTWTNRDGDFEDAEDTVTNRTWFMGDPLHSRPLDLNFGAVGSYTADNPELRIVVGDNGGAFHMFRNNLPGPAPGVPDGVEAWAFVPREIMATLIRLKDNNAGTPVHPYTVDGSTSAFITQLDGSIIGDETGESVWIFFGFRRGGKGYYAFDVTTPDTPELKWKIFKDDPSGDFAELGQSWSVANVKLARLDADGLTSTTNDIGVKKVAVFGGGFNGDDGGDKTGDLGKDARDPLEANDPPGDNATWVGSDDDEGNAVFVVNADNGSLIWKAVHGASTLPYNAVCQCYTHADLVDSIPSIVSVADLDGIPGIDRGYVGDTGGRVWRLDMASPYLSDWKLTKFFEAGRHDNATKVNDRRFFARPAVVPASDVFGPFDGVVIPSGDRPHPLGTAVENWLYVIKDRHIAGMSPPPDNASLTESDLQDRTDHCLQDGDGTDCSTADLNLPQHGYKIRLEQCDGLTSTGLCGEKGVSSPLVQSGDLFVNTYVPQGIQSCSPAEGIGLEYRIDFQTGAAVFDFNVTIPNFERFNQMLAPGIPAEGVPTGRQILQPDLDFEDVEGDSIIQTFWYEVDRRNVQ